MPFSIPIPFIVAMVDLGLVVLVVKSGPLSRARALAVTFLTLSAVLSVMTGLRFGYHMQAIGKIQPLLAALVPPLAYLTFRALGDFDAWRWPRLVLLHGLPVAAVWTARALAPDLIDLFLSASFTGYGLALLRLSRSGQDRLAGVKFGGIAPALAGLRIVAVLLLTSALVDILANLDLIFARGERIPVIIALASTFVLLFMGIGGYLAWTQDGAQDESQTPAKPRQDEPVAADNQVMATVDRALSEQRLFRDSNLTLNRLARRLGMPARQISQAVNRTHGQNVSQYVNGFRIAQACSLLRETNAPVTEIQLDVGFETKSNFNREFRRITGMSPTQYRQMHADDATRPR